MSVTALLFVLPCFININWTTLLQRNEMLFQYTRQRLSPHVIFVLIRNRRTNSKNEYGRDSQKFIDITSRTLLATVQTDPYKSCLPPKFRSALCLRVAPSKLTLSHSLWFMNLLRRYRGIENRRRGFCSASSFTRCKMSRIC